MMLEVFVNDKKAGELAVFGRGEGENYRFYYDEEWRKSGFALEPNLPLECEEFVSSDLWGCFADASPDRWGQKISGAAKGYETSASERLVGAKDRWREGALRFKFEGEFVSSNLNIKGLCDLPALFAAAKAFETGECGAEQIALLEDAGGASVGGARPKACVEIDDEPYIAKFSSIRDEALQIPRLEKTLLDLARVAGIKTCETKLKQTPLGVALLVKRFDRADGARIAYISARTLLGAKASGRVRKSYLDVAILADERDRGELFSRMVFNAIFGNTDDHLRNCGFLRGWDAWRLSPAFDLTSSRSPLALQRHSTAFFEGENKADVKLFARLSEFFGLSEGGFKEILARMLKAWNARNEIARKNGLKSLADFPALCEQNEHIAKIKALI